MTVARTALGLALTVVLAGGCSTDAPEAPIVAPTATPEPEPEPELPTVVTGEVGDVHVEDVSIGGSGLHHEGTAEDAATAVDTGAIDAVVAATTAWLDDHLTDLQVGGTGAILPEGYTGDAAGLTTGLTDPSKPVTSARYGFTVGARGTPEWIQVTVELDRHDAQGASATFVFRPTDEGVELLAAQPAAGTGP